MRAYLDTNVLIAASVEDHQHHLQSFDLIKAVKEEPYKGALARTV